MLSGCFGVSRDKTCLYVLLSSPLLTHNTLLGLKNTDLTWVKSRSKYLKTKQEFEPVGGEPAVYLRVAGRRGEPETLTESILFQLKARAA